MAKLILEEGGKRRRFRLNEGKMTIGSGDAATLTLADEGVAEVHAELVFRDGDALLVPRKGVAPVKVQGRAVSGEVKLKNNVPVMIGGAKLMVDYELDEAAPKAAGKSAGKTAARSSRAAASDDAGSDSGGRVQRTRSRAERKPGIPGWLTAVAILAVVVVAFFFVKNSIGGVDAEAFDGKTSQYRIEESLENGDFQGALSELDRIKPIAKSDEWTRAFNLLRQKADELARVSSDASRNAQGNPYLETQLKKFVSGRLKKDPSSRPKARVFTKRAKWFLSQYPTHNERDWVDRHIERYASVAAMHEPSTFEDMAFETEALTWAYPADFRQAFKAVAEFRARATEQELARLAILEADLRTAETEYFNTRYDEAQDFWAINKSTQMRNNPGKAVERLVQMIIKLDNPEYINKAATTLTKMESKESSILSIFRGYRNDRPDKWEALLANSTVRSFLEQHDVL